MYEAAQERVFYRYPPRRLLADYLRAGVGAAFCLLVLLAAEPVPALTWIFGALAAIFLLFGLHTARLHMTRVALDEGGIYTKHMVTSGLSWEQLERLRLRYFGSRRQRKQARGGALELTLWGGGQKMKFDSQVEGFRDIAWHALQAARARDLAIDEATADNLLSLGLNPESHTPRPPPGERDVESI